MASLIAGYEYDIFISYRQKDNKYDGWVTEFANHLKSELEATFKEEVSVYFDFNPHDGLLDTYDVEESLKEKLRCLVFIPVISRTYCDPKSFAWEHEFRAFIGTASVDRFGLKVKLPAGNVASRVLPVQIHEIKADDRALVEKTLGGFMRAIEFIYSEPGVNRPLTPADSEERNILKISYRNQINKVANSIEGVITGLLTAASSRKEDQVPDMATPSVSGTKKFSRNKLTIAGEKKLTLGSGVLIILLGLVSIFFFSGGSNLPFSRRDWILIADFENHTGNPVFGKSLYTAFSLSAGQSRYVNVFTRSRMIETMARMKISGQNYIDEDTGREIAMREGISLIIVPGISEAGTQYALTAKILEARTGDILKSEVLYAGTEEEILPAIDRLSVRIRKDLGESRYHISQQDKPLKKVTTSSLPALQQYSIGYENHLQSDFTGAKQYYGNALKIDTGFIAAKASLGSLLLQNFNDTTGKELLIQAARDAGSLTDREKYSIVALYAESIEHDYDKAIASMEILKRLYPDDPVVRNNLGWYYQQTKQYQIALKEYKEAVRINPRMGLTYAGILWIYGDYVGNVDSSFAWAGKMIADNPGNVWGYFYMGSAWFCRDSLENSVEWFKKAFGLNPDFTHNQYRLIHAYMRLGKYAEAIELLDNILSRNPGEAPAYYLRGCNYKAMGNVGAARPSFLKFRNIAEEYWLKHYPDDYATYKTLACVAARLDEKELSVQMLKKAAELDSSQYFSFAEVLCLQGDISGALQNIELALKNGYRNLYMLKASPDLTALQFDIRLQNLLKEYFRFD